jgi:hypothetical protein
MDWKVGQVVYIDGNEATITKIGRKWIYYKRDWTSNRFDVQTGFVDGGNFSQRRSKVWASIDEYRNEIERQRMFVELRKIIPNYGPAPDHMTREMIEGALKSLGAV